MIVREEKMEGFQKKKSHNEIEIEEKKRMGFQRRNDTQKKRVNMTGKVQFLHVVNFFLSKQQPVC